eukprot:CAMPEP_0185589480 /NCGR_PEP_ID=MMETSP0434-20130131/57261_1 /TAXON_ID=626734 ORGANISM="Favella taraikaensis, Strain Fe Narragansett Bay" /NCGR_SAMPLE_ID=MMETSP0434 /ASSEMBLY_ACC=CAM_ASM_000379 /LENGTH=45 /DNA_ID= /DNA_START= /DNA_END= /DNA_ORIENTATION=
MTVLANKATNLHIPEPLLQSISSDADSNGTTSEEEEEEKEEPIST